MKLQAFYNYWAGGNFMNILFIGDISGRPGREAVHKYLFDIREKHSIDMVIANGENASGGLGMNRDAYEELSSAGIDMFTMGNHVFSKKEIHSLMDNGENIVRPANFPKGAPGKGYTAITIKNGIKIAIVNLMGRTFMDANFDNPFTVADDVLKEITAKIIFLDFHAEATSEKKALGYYLDGRVTAIIGTHTHVQTNDAQILPKGTAYLTDAGMTGARDSVLGVKPEIAIYKFTTGLPRRHEIAEGELQFNAVIIQVDDETGKAKKIEIVNI